MSASSQSPTVPQQQQAMKKRRPRRSRPVVAVASVLSVGMLLSSMEFLLPVVSGFTVGPSAAARTRTPVVPSPPSTALSVWSFGGSETIEAFDADADSCELVPVRIERTSANSRKIFGEITVPMPLMDVWAILTDYDNLSTHVPNLVESKMNRQLSGGEPGDGQYRCRLFQRGAQKVFGFEFGASVTMDMREMIVAPSSSSSLADRRISFKCYDSFFFSEFDGEWKAQERMNAETGQVETVLSYVVDVRPKGPVPVAALEWRIKEDVPVNLRSVKRAACQVGYEGVMALRHPGREMPRLPPHQEQQPAQKGGLLSTMKMNVKWYKDETMAAYLTD